MKREAFPHPSRLGLYTEEVFLQYRKRTGKIVSQIKFVLLPSYLGYLFLCFFGPLLDIDGRWLWVPWLMVILGSLYFTVRLNKESTRFRWIMDMNPVSPRETAHDKASPDRAQVGALRLLEAVSLLVPRRISDEEIGDALELVCRLSKANRPSWQIYLKVASTVFWIGMNAIREVSSSLLGKKKPIRR